MEIVNCDIPARRALLEFRLCRFIDREKLKIQRLILQSQASADRLERLVEVCQEIQRVLLLGENGQQM